MRLLSEAKNKDGGRPRVILMTGTPISESPLNAYVVLKMLSFDPIPHISRFENYYCDKKKIKIGRTKKIRKIVGFKNLDELKTRIERVSIRRTKDDLSGFPDKVVVIRDVFLKGKQLSMYRAICGEVVKELSDKAVINLYSFLNSSNSILRLRQLMNHPNLLNDTGESSKYEEIDYILEEILDNPENKAVIWTAFRKSVENLYE
jgi:SNF2 family DNA or RNA helicase